MIKLFISHFYTLFKARKAMALMQMLVYAVAGLLLLAVLMYIAWKFGGEKLQNLAEKATP